MNVLVPQNRKRKVLRLKKETKPEALAEIASSPTRFTRREDCVFMVFNENGDMPKRIYRPDEIHLACAHALILASMTGNRFHVMRSWRAFKPVAGDDE